MALTSEEYKRFFESTKEFLWSEIAPLEERIEATGDVPLDELWPKFKEHRLLGLLIPEEYGGLGLTECQYIPILAEESKVHGGIRAIVHVQNAIGQLMVLAGREEQRREYLPTLAVGDLSGALGLTEPDAGTGRDVKTTATRDGDNFILNGRKHLITNMTFAQLCFVVCYTNREKGVMSIVIVERDRPGFIIEDMPPTMGARGCFHARLTFKDCVVPVSNVLGKEGEGLDQTLYMLDLSRMHIAATSLGTAERCLELAVDFAKKRVTFGKPIGERQAVQGYLADMAMDIYALRQMLFHLAQKVDEEKRIIGAESAMCKLFGSEAVGRVTDRALLVFGGIGYTREYPIERLYRDARLNWLEEGTPTIMRMVIARDLLKGAMW